jgi:maleate cis-trans isomerase
MPSNYFKVGLIVPSSNTVMEPDFHRALGQGCAISTARIYLEQVTREAEESMIEDDLPHALRLIKTTDPHVVVFGCTSAGSLGGLESDAGIARRIEELTGARALTVLGSVVEQLKAIGPRRVAVLTPYEEELTLSVAKCVVDSGYELAKTAGMGIRSNRDIGRSRPARSWSSSRRRSRALTPIVFFSRARTGRRSMPSRRSRLASAGPSSRAIRRRSTPFECEWRVSTICRPPAGAPPSRSRACVMRLIDPPSHAATFGFHPALGDGDADPPTCLHLLWRRGAQDI